LKLLAIDTSTEACSAALAVDNAVTHTRFELAPQRHAELILPMVDHLLREADLRVGELDGLAFGQGPGTFTGVRIAAGIIQGIALGAELPIVPVSSLAALAQGLFSERGQARVLAAIDARIGEIYWGAYQVDERGILMAVQAQCVGKPDTVPVPVAGRWFGAGTGWDSYGPILRKRLGGDRLLGIEPRHYPHAREVAILGIEAFKAGHGIQAEYALPAYLRDKVVD
jgi:tRNA threonylcarbamoyladenosine biosynthesis protein TsaB